MRWCDRVPSAAAMFFLHWSLIYCRQSCVKYCPPDFSVGVYHSIEQLNTLLNMNSQTEDGLTRRRSGSLTLETEWEEKYFFIKYQRSKCLLCCISVVKRKFNVERHYENKHASTYDSIVGDDRRKMIENLKKTLSNDVRSITTFNNNNNSNNNNDNNNKIIIMII